jgi:hypothetical protein
VARETAEERIERALAAFDRGDRRAAWDSLTTMARREPTDLRYRRTLVTTYRAAGHPDQAARWGASDPASLPERERRILLRAASRARSTAALREYLALPQGLPPEVAAALPTPAEQRRRRTSALADGLAVSVTVVASVLAGPAVSIGIVVTLVRAFLGDPSAHAAAQVTATAALLAAAVLGLLLALVAGLRGRWTWAVVALVAVVAAVVVLAHADMTTTTPFDRRP